MNKSVNFEIAKILKEKGFKESTEANWWILTKDHSDNYMNGLPVDESKIFFAKDSYELESKIQIDENTEHNVFHFLRAPTIPEVVMWLYEKHGIWVEAGYGFQPQGFYWLITMFKDKKSFHSETNAFQLSFNSPTEAYEAAITYTLEKLI